MSFVERWARVWAEPTPEAVRDLSAPDIVMSWPGVDQPIRGADAWAGLVSGMLALLPDLRLEVTAHAQHVDVLFISWRARATVNGIPTVWQGIDRMRIQDGVVTESLVAFDTAVLQPAA